MSQVRTDKCIDATKLKIKKIILPLPLKFKIMNYMGGFLKGLSSIRNILSLDSMLNEAQNITGLSDWGDENFLIPLRMLTEPDEEKFKLTLVGKAILRSNLVHCLKNRLLIQQELKSHPEIVEVPIHRPLFITGLPRTGTTLLQNLLSLDPFCRPLLCWEALHPAPSPDPHTHKTDPRIAAMEKAIKSSYKYFPQHMAIHHMSAGKPDECMHLLKNSFLEPIAFRLLAHFPQYIEWQKEQNMVPAYQYYRRQLQILQWKFPPAHWVLKAPVHLIYLDALLEVFPDALVIQLHRDPHKVVPSFLSLVGKSMGMGNRFDKNAFAELSESIIDSMQEILERAISIRSRHDSSKFLDIHYNDLMVNPISAIQRIYKFFGYKFSNTFEERIASWLRENPQAKYGKHSYSLEQFGLIPEALKNRFAKIFP